MCSSDLGKAQELIASINASSRTIRYELAQKVRFQLRKTPELSFFLDDSLDYLENIDKLLGTDSTEQSSGAESRG